MATWLITGCSSGLGRNLAQAVLEAGFNAVLTARNTASLADLVSAFPETAKAVALDVTDKAQVRQAVAKTVERFGVIDVLVNNAGYGYRAAVEEADDEEVQHLFATNFFGAVSMIKEVLPIMRAHHSGTVVNLSSIAGRRASPGSAYYAASKFALEGMSDALRKEVGPLGLHVIVVEPGAFRTDFAGRSLQQATAKIADYAKTSGLRRKENDKSHGTQPGDPRRAAQAIMQAVSSSEPPFRLLLGGDAVGTARDELEQQQREIERWEKLSLSTDFAAGA